MLQMDKMSLLSVRFKFYLQRLMILFWFISFLRAEKLFVYNQNGLFAASSLKINQFSTKKPTFDIRLSLKTVDFTFETTYSTKPSLSTDYQKYIATSCLFSGCADTTNGGAIELEFSIDDTKTLQIQQTTFFQCSAGTNSNGGAVYSMIATTSIRTTCFSMCTAGNHGFYAYINSFSSCTINTCSGAGTPEGAKGSGSFATVSGAQSISYINSSNAHTTTDFSGLTLTPSSISSPIQYIEHVYNTGKYVFAITPSGREQISVQNVNTVGNTDIIDFIAVFRVSNNVDFSNCYFLENTYDLIEISESANLAFTNCYVLFDNYTEYQFNVLTAISYPRYNFLSSGYCNPNHIIYTSGVIPSSTGNNESIPVIGECPSNTGLIVALIIFVLLFLGMVVFNILHFFVIPYHKKRKEEKEKMRQALQEQQRKKAEEKEVESASSDDETDQKDKKKVKDSENPSSFDEEEEEEEEIIHRHHHSPRHKSPVPVPVRKSSKKKIIEEEEEEDSSEPNKNIRNSPKKSPSTPHRQKDDIHWDSDSSDEDSDDKPKHHSSRSSPRKPSSPPHGSPRSPRTKERRPKQPEISSDDDEKQNTPRKVPSSPGLKRSAPNSPSHKDSLNDQLLNDSPESTNEPLEEEKVHHRRRRVRRSTAQELTDPPTSEAPPDESEHHHRRRRKVRKPHVED